MHRLVKYWQRDLINKLIVLASLLLVLGVVGLVYLVFAMPEGKSIQGAAAEYLHIGVPTLSPQEIQTHSAATAQAKPTETFTPLPPTITSLPTRLILPTPTLTLTIEPIEPSPTSVASATSTNTNTPIPVITNTAVVVTPAGSSSAACLPANPVQNAFVVEVLDGNTIRALIDGLVYTVRYIGIDPPQNANFANAATYENYVLVYGREVQLIPGDSDKDARGRLLRYVKVKDTFVNIDLLQKGLATLSKGESEFICLADFLSAEQQARSANMGLWSLPQPTPTP